jgi:hypothetical protein
MSGNMKEAQASPEIKSPDREHRRNAGISLSYAPRIIFIGAVYPRGAGLKLILAKPGRFAWAQNVEPLQILPAISPGGPQLYSKFGVALRAKLLNKVVIRPQILALDDVQLLFVDVGL